MTDKLVDELSFEEGMKELDGIVQRLEAGNLALEDSISVYERGTQLKKHCESKLREAILKVEKISIGPEGDVALTPAHLG